MKGITQIPAVSGFGRSVRIFLADSQGFHHFMATDLEHEDIVETAVFGPENNLIVTGSRDTLIQVRRRPRAYHPHLCLWNQKYDFSRDLWTSKYRKTLELVQAKPGGSLGAYEGVFLDSVTDLGGITKIFNEGDGIPTEFGRPGRFWPSEWSKVKGEGRKIPIKLKVLKAGEKDRWLSSVSPMVWSQHIFMVLKITEDPSSTFTYVGYINLIYIFLTSDLFGNNFRIYRRIAKRVPKYIPALHLACPNMYILFTQSPLSKPRNQHWDNTLNWSVDVLPAFPQMSFFLIPNPIQIPHCI